MAKPGHLQLMLSNFLRVLQDAGAPPIDSTSVNAVHKTNLPRVFRQASLGQDTLYLASAEPECVVLVRSN